MFLIDHVMSRSEHLKRNPSLPADSSIMSPEILPCSFKYVNDMYHVNIKRNEICKGKINCGFQYKGNTLLSNWNFDQALRHAKEVTGLIVHLNVLCRFPEKRQRELFRHWGRISAIIFKGNNYIYIDRYPE